MKNMHKMDFSIEHQSLRWQHAFRNGILFSKLFWPTVRKNCSSDREKLLKFEAGGREFENERISNLQCEFVSNFSYWFIQPKQYICKCAINFLLNGMVVIWFDFLWMGPNCKHILRFPSSDIDFGWIFLMIR